MLIISIPHFPKNLFSTAPSQLHILPSYFYCDSVHLILPYAQGCGVILWGIVDLSVAIPKRKTTLLPPGV